MIQLNLKQELLKCQEEIECAANRVKLLTKCINYSVMKNYMKVGNEGWKRRLEVKTGSEGKKRSKGEK